MSRVLLALLAALALTTSVAWYALSLEPQRPAPAPAGAQRSAPASEAPGADLRAADPTPEHAAASDGAPAVDARAAVPGAREEALANARWVEGRVVFPPGTPADEELFVVADGGDHRARVEPDGRFRVAFSERTREGVLRLEGRYLFLREDRTWSRGSSGEIVLRPELGARVLVRVLPPAGEPPTSGPFDLFLAYRDMQSFEFSTHMPSSGARLVGKAAEVEFGGVHCDSPLTLSLHSREYLADPLQPQVQPGQVANLELALQRGLAVRGRVLDEQGQPLEGVSVIARSTDETRAGLPSHIVDATTAADGTFVAGALDPGPFVLHARRKGYLSHEQEVAPTGGPSAQVDVVLRRGGIVSGTVRWPDGTPARAEVRLSAGPEGGQTTRDGEQVETDAEGRFVASALTAEAYHVRASAAHVEEVPVVSALTGRERMRSQVRPWCVELAPVAVGTTELELVLTPGLSLRGTVVDETGAPLDDFDVRSARLSFPGSPGDTTSTPGARYRDARGSFELTGLAPGTWIVQAAARDRVDSDWVEVQLPASAPVVLVLPREAVVRGVVLDPDGAPAQFAVVQAVQPGVRGRRFLPDGGEVEDYVEDDGVFEIEGLHAGTTRLTARSSSGLRGATFELELVPGQVVEDVVLRLTQSCTLTGQVVDRSGRPEAGIEVWVRAREDERTTYYVTDAEGGFRANDLSAGRATVHTTTGEGLRLEAEVELRTSATPHVRLEPPPGSPIRLHGRVLLGGEPQAGVRLDAWRTDRGDERSGVSVSALEETDEHGRYQLVLPGPGPWLVRAFGFEAGPELWSLPVDVPATSSLELDLVVPVGRVSGRVVDDAGEPIAGLLVRSEPRKHDGGPRGTASAQTGADGRYELVLPAGLHGVVAGGEPEPWQTAATGWSRMIVEDVHVTEGERVSGIDFVLRRGGTLVGTVRGPTGAPAQQALIVLCEADRAIPLGGANSNGGFRLEGLPEGSHWIRAVTQSAGSPSAERVTIRAGEEAQVDLALVPGAFAWVRALDEAGAALGCEIVARDAQGHCVPALESGELGSVRFGPLTPGSYRVTARRESKVTERTLEVTGLEEELELVLGFE